MTIATFSAEAVVLEARSWIGTPYHHQASAKGVGADCLGLVRGVWRALGEGEVGERFSYTRDWAEASGIETMLLGARRYLLEVASDKIVPGDVLVFRLRPQFVAKHAAIMTSDRTMIHAMEGCVVSEVPLSQWWRRRIAGAFRFPDLRNGQ